MRRPAPPSERTPRVGFAADGADLRLAARALLRLPRGIQPSVLSRTAIRRCRDPAVWVCSAMVTTAAFGALCSFAPLSELSRALAPVTAGFEPRGHSKQHHEHSEEDEPLASCRGREEPNEASHDKDDYWDHCPGSYAPRSGLLLVKSCASPGDLDTGLDSAAHVAPRFSIAVRRVQPLKFRLCRAGECTHAARVPYLPIRSRRATSRLSPQRGHVACLQHHALRCFDLNCSVGSANEDRHRAWNSNPPSSPRDAGIGKLILGTRIGLPDLEPKHSSHGCVSRGRTDTGSPRNQEGSRRR